MMKVETEVEPLRPCSKDSIEQDIKKDSKTNDDSYIYKGFDYVKKNSKSNDEDVIIRNPKEQDVLIGRGKPFQNHVGNKKMLQIIDIYQQRYHDSERAYKQKIVEEVLYIIHRSGGRFLERCMDTDINNVCCSTAVDDKNCSDGDGSCWDQVSHIRAYRKVGHAFRSCKRKGGRNKNNHILIPVSTHKRTSKSTTTTTTAAIAAALRQQEMIDDSRDISSQIIAATTANTPTTYDIVATAMAIAANQQQKQQQSRNNISSSTADSTASSATIVATAMATSTMYQREHLENVVFGNRNNYNPCTNKGSYHRHQLQLQLQQEQRNHDIERTTVSKMTNSMNYDIDGGRSATIMRSVEEGAAAIGILGGGSSGNGENLLLHCANIYRQEEAASASVVAATSTSKSGNFFCQEAAVALASRRGQGDSLMSGSGDNHVNNHHGCYGNGKLMSQSRPSPITNTNVANNQHNYYHHHQQHQHGNILIGNGSGSEQQSSSSSSSSLLHLYNRMRFFNKY